jgi:ubiquinone biosynthesis protein UbiJ
VPKTPTGRWAGVVIMITGIAVLGVLAGALSSFFRLGENQADEPATPATAAATPAAATPAAATPTEVAIAALTAEVAALRHQVEVLARRLPGASPGQPPD